MITNFSKLTPAPQIHPSIPLFPISLVLVCVSVACRNTFLTVFFILIYFSLFLSQDYSWEVRGEVKPVDKDLIITSWWSQPSLSTNGPRLWSSHYELWLLCVCWLKLSLMCVCLLVCVCLCAHAPLFVYGGQRYMGINSLFDRVGPGDQIQVFRLDRRLLNPLSHLTGPVCWTFALIWSPEQATEIRISVSIYSWRHRLRDDKELI